MHIDSVKNPPAAAPPAKPATQSASAQAAAAFASHLKKNQAEQLSRAMKHGRRDSVGRMLAADESAPGIPALLDAGEDVVERTGERHRDQQDKQHDEQKNEQISEQISEQPRQQSDVADRPMLDRADQLATDILADQLAPLSDDGLFDVLQPDGSVLSVAVTHSPARVSLLLSTTSVGSSTQLRRCKMELEHRLGRRIGKDVAIAVL